MDKYKILIQNDHKVKKVKTVDQENILLVKKKKVKMCIQIQLLIQSLMMYASSFSFSSFS